jgi:hypothetical protein
MLTTSKNEAAANVDLARRRSRAAAFVALKSVSLDVEMLEGKGLVHQHQA